MSIVVPFVEFLSYDEMNLYVLIVHKQCFAKQIVENTIVIG